MKIPIVKATTDIPTGIPVTVRPETAGMEWGAAQGLGLEVERLALQISEEEKRFNDNKKRVDIAQAVETTSLSLTQANEEIITKRRQNPDVENYFPLWENDFVNAAKEITGQFKDPDVRKAAETIANRIQASETSQQTNYSRKLWVDEKQGIGLRNIYTAIEMGNPQLAYDLLESNVKIGAFPPDVAEKMREHIKTESEKKRVKDLTSSADLAIYDNPYAAEKILKNPEYKDIPEDKKLVLIQKGNARVDRFEKQVEKEAKDTSEVEYAGLTKRIRDVGKPGTMETLADLEEEVNKKGPAGNRTLTKANFDTALERIDSHRKAIDKRELDISDQEVLRDVTIRSSMAVPKITEGEIIAKMKPGGGLSTKDGEGALDKLKITNRTLDNEAMQTVNRRYADARDRIQHGLGVFGMILQLQEKLDPTQGMLLDRAWNELWNRSSGRGGDEDPIKVADEILPVYRKALAGQGLLSIETYKKIIEIDKYPTQNDLLKARDTMPATDFYRKSKAFMEMKKQEDLNEYLNKGNKEDFGRGKK